MKAIGLGTAMAAGIFLNCILAGFVLAPMLGPDLLAQLNEFVSPLRGRGSVEILVFIFVNNTIKTLLAVVLGVALGLPSLFFISTNGVAVGVVTALVGESAGFGKVVAGLAPHGIFEIPAVLVSTGIGFAVAAEVVKLIMKQKSAVGVTLVRGLKYYAIGVVPALAVAAFIEVYLTPIVVKLVTG